MKKPQFVLCSSLLLAALSLPASALAAPPSPPMSISVLPSSGPRAVAVNKTVTLRLKTSGVELNVAHMGKQPRDSEGHIQVYIDRVPKDAYTKADLRHNWLASVIATTIPLKLTRAVIGGKMGKHTLIVALARNNNVLYKVKTASLIVTVK